MGPAIVQRRPQGNVLVHQRYNKYVLVPEHRNRRKRRDELPSANPCHAIFHQHAFSSMRAWRVYFTCGNKFDVIGDSRTSCGCR
jgi:hypothetical protein